MSTSITGPDERLLRLDPPTLREGYIWVVSVAWVALQIYAGLRHIDILRLVHIHVLTAISLTFALNPTPADRIGTALARALDTVFALSPMVILAYLLLNYQRLRTRIPQVAEVATFDLVFGTLLVILLLEATRRVTGLVLPLIGLAFIAYMFVGPSLPPLVQHSGIRFAGMIDMVLLSDSAVFGIPAKIAARYVFLFVLFGAVLLESGAGELFLDLAKSIAGSLKGGAAKIAVMSSALMASINGSAVANTVSTGSITIPLMTDSGYDEETSGAIESLASTGGQLMPPVMGAAAFVLAELSGVPYLDLIIYAVLPSLLYYLGVYSSVHLEAVKQDIPAIPRSELPAVRDMSRRTAHLAIPIVGLLYVLFETGNIELAAGGTVVLTYLAVQLRSETRMGVRQILGSARRGAEMVLAATLPCAIAGLIIGVVFFSGIAARLTNVILSLTGGTLVVTLVFVAVVSVVLGMGMPTTGAYITVAVLAVPSLTALGVTSLSAHLFGLYFAVFSMITPPIAIAAFAAASISGGNAWDTGIKAFLMGLPTYTIPFLFVLHPSLVLQTGSTMDTVYWFVIAALVVVTMSMIGVGYAFGELSLAERTVLAVGCLVVLAVPAYYWVGIGLIMVGMAKQALTESRMSHLAKSFE